MALALHIKFVALRFFEKCDAGAEYQIWWGLLWTIPLIPLDSIPRDADTDISPCDTHRRPEWKGQDVSFFIECTEYWTMILAHRPRNKGVPFLRSVGELYGCFILGPQSAAKRNLDLGTWLSTVFCKSSEYGSSYTADQRNLLPGSPREINFNSKPVTNGQHGRNKV